METNLIRKVLNACEFLNDFDVDFDDEDGLYSVEMDIITPRDSDDMSRLLQLKNKVRAQVNTIYKIDFTIRFTT